VELKDYPRPCLEELRELYSEMDDLVAQAEELFRSLRAEHFEEENEIIHFGRMSVDDVKDLVARKPDVMVIALTRVCGLSAREFSRVFGLDNPYALRHSAKWESGEKEHQFATAIKSLLPPQMYLETFLYCFYRMWEEDQRRHHRGRFEVYVRNYVRDHGYECGKITSPTEVNGAIPPEWPDVVMQIRTGVRMDLVKRAKEFSTEFDESIKAFPKARFAVVFKIPEHELGRREEVRRVINEQRAGRPYDGVYFQDELEGLIEQLEKWGVRKTGGLRFDVM
jgi:hypothetical protein